MQISDYSAFFCALLGSLALAPPVVAQDAGQIVREVERGIDREVPQNTLLPDIFPSETGEHAADAARTVPAGERFRVESFQIESTLISPEELQAEVRSFVGRDCTITDLREAAARISAAYRKRGLLAYVSIPAQTLRDGMVRLQVIEARLGKVTVDAGPDVRLKPDVAQSFITSRVSEGDVVRLDKVASGIAALRTISGVDARGILRAGAAPGSTDVHLRLAEQRPVAFTALIDNQTTSELGGVRLLGIIALNDFDGEGKRVALTGQLTEHSRFAEITTALPLSYGKLWLDGAVSFVDYSIGSAVEASGSGKAANIGLRWYAGQRSSAPVMLTSGFEYRRISNDLANVNVASNRLMALSFGVYSMLAGKDSRGTTAVDLRLRVGDLDLGGNSGNLDFDSTTAQTNGRFAKLTGLVAYSYPIDRNWGVRFALNGQIASKNLNGIERLAFGGPGGVAGYSIARLDGDEGALASFELSRSLSSRSRISAGWAGGRVAQHKRPWQGWSTGPTDRNAYTFQGVSASAKFAIRDNLLLTTEVGVPLVKVPSLQGRERGPVRAWVRLVNVVE